MVCPFLSAYNIGPNDGHKHAVNIEACHVGHADADSETVRISSKRGWGRLMESGVEIYVYEPTMLHCKMLIFDRFNVYGAPFAQRMTQVFERDLASSVKYTYERWRNRSWGQKAAEVVLLPIRSQL